MPANLNLSKTRTFLNSENTFQGLKFEDHADLLKVYLKIQVLLGEQY